VLQSDVQIYFATLQLQRDVAELVKGWFEDGAPLGLMLGTFKQLLRLDGSGNADPDALFHLFDTDGNQKADALEVLCAVILLAKGTVEEKLEALFPIFDFSSNGSYSFDELNILVHSVCRGLSKACLTPRAKDEDLVVACRQMFDAHNLPYEKPISRDQVKRWVRNDVEATHFVKALQDVVSLPMLEVELARREEAQAAAFAQLCGTEAPPTVDEAKRNAALRKSFGDLPDDVLADLLSAAAGGDSVVTPERFSRAARAWNAFVILDTAAEGTLAASELRLLLRLREHEAPPESIEQLHEAIVQDGLVPRASWLAASLQAE